MISESGVVLKMLRILKKALAKLRYRGGCHRERSRNNSKYSTCLAALAITEIEKISTLKIKIFYGHFLNLL